VIKHLALAERCGDLELSQLLMTFPRVNSLALNLCSQVSDDGWAALLQLPRIRCLEFSEDNHDLCRLRLVSDYPHLQELKVNMCDRAPVPFPALAWGGITSLRRLTVYSDNPFDTVMHLPLLEHLESDHNSISTACLQRLVHLTSLHLHLPEDPLGPQEREEENRDMFLALSNLHRLQSLQLMAGPTMLSLMCISKLSSLTCLQFLPEEIRYPICPLLSLTQLCHLSKLCALSCEFVSDSKCVVAQLASEQDGDVHWAVPWSPLRFSLKYC